MSNFAMNGLKSARILFRVKTVLGKNDRFRYFLMKNIQFWYEIDRIFHESLRIRMFLIKNLRF